MLKSMKRAAALIVTQTAVLGFLLPGALAATFSLEEATIADINKAFDAGALTAEELVRLYLNRIEVYDSKLNSILLINPSALETARDLDLERQTNGARSPLHGIPVLLKDNYDTFDLPTTAGSLSLADSIPPDDAFQTRRLREAGAIILGKTNIHEFARGGTTISSLGGQTVNPYDLTRIPGGSSGGSGAAVSANFAVLGTATDTIGSILGPAAFSGLVGIRPTIGLTSRDGIVPFSLDQDVGGPLARTVTDAALMLDVLSGFDSADPITANSIGKIPSSYTELLSTDSLQGVRIGAIRQLIQADQGGNPTAPEVLSLINSSLDDLKALGAEVIDVTIPDLTFLLATNPNRNFDRFKFDLNNYLASLGSDSSIRTLDEIIESGQYSPAIATGLINANLKTLTPDEDPTYELYLQNRENLRTVVGQVAQQSQLDAFVFPARTQPPPLIEGGAGQGSNSALSAYTGFPSIAVPAGFTSEGLPVSLEFFGNAFSEASLLSYAFAYEQYTLHRRPPSLFPSLSGEEIEYELGETIKHETVPEPGVVIALGMFGISAFGLKLRKTVTT